MTRMTVYESMTIGDRVCAANRDIIKILVDARLTPAVAVGLLEELKFTLMVAGRYK